MPGLKIVRFEPDHLSGLQLQPAQSGFFDLLDEDTVKTIAGGVEAWTAFADGRPMICSGIIEQRKGLALAWSYIAADARPHMLAISRAASFILARQTFPRIEAHALRSHPPAGRWLRLLGFKLETPNGMACFTPDGRDMDLWARIRRPQPRRFGIRPAAGVKLLLSEV